MSLNLKESLRIKAVDLALSVTEEDKQCFDDLAKLSAEICRTKMSAITLVGKEKLFVRGKFGVEISETLTSQAFSGDAIQEEELLLVPKTDLDSRFMDKYFVNNYPFVKFFCGVKLVLPSGEVIGTLSVFDDEYKELSPAQIKGLKILSKQVISQLEVRIKARESKFYVEALEDQKTKFTDINSMYESLTQSIKDAIIALDSSGRIISWNRGAERIFGYSAGDVINQSVQLIMPLKYRDLYEKGILKRALNQSLEQSSVIGKTLELVALRKDGSEFPIELSVSTINTPSGICYSGILRDITERKQMLNELEVSKALLEQKVQERTADLKTLMDSIPQIVWEAGTDGRFTYMGNKLQEFTGIPFVASSAKAVIHPEDLQSTLERWRLSLKTGDIFESEFRMKAKDGVYRWFLARGIKQEINNGKLHKWFGTCTDIHDAKVVNEIQNNFFALPDVMLCLSNADGYLIKVNKAWEQTLGFTSKELQERPFIDFVHPDDLSGTIAEFEKIKDGANTLNFENRYLCKDGSYKWIQWTSVPRDGLFYCVAKDVTYLKQSQIAIKESEIRFKTILEQSPFPTIVISKTGRITKINDAWKTLWNVSEEKLRSFLAEFNILQDPFIKALGFSTQIENAFKGIPSIIPPTFYDPASIGMSARGKWLKTYINPIMGLNGELSEVLIKVADITDQKNAEEAVRAKQNELQSILDNSSSIIFVKDLEGKFLLVNSEFERVFNTTQEKIFGKDDFDLFPEDHANEYRRNDKYIIDHNIAVRKEEVAPQPDGIHTYLSAKFPVHDGNGKVIGMGGISTDITQIKKAEYEKSMLEIREKSAVEANKLKSTFLANMSHEIRTPINGVLGMTGLLLDTNLSEEQKDYADTIRRSGEALLTVVNDILDFSKIEAGKLDFEELNFDLWDVIDDSQKTMSFSARKKALQLQIIMDSELPRSFTGDPGRLKQVFLNLLSNAIKFTPSGSVVLKGSCINIKDGKARLRFEIIDSGIGISAEAIKEMFQPFKQADASTQRKYGGTGLGLSICKRLIEHWDGDIGVESKIGFGSTFWFEITLPIQNIKIQEPSQPQRSPNMISKKVRILVAEDNPVNQVIAVKMLQKMGFYADVAGNGFEALNALRTAPYDLVLMDCQMPECDGYQATRLIRGLETSTRNICILAMTANAMTGDAEKCLEAGMDGYLTKPISANKLQGIIEDWLSKKTVA